MRVETIKKGEKVGYGATYTAEEDCIIGTLPIGYVKQTGMEYQCTHPTGQKGLDNVMACWEAGSLKHIVPKLAEGQDPFYSMIPTTFSLTKVEEDLKKTAFFDLNADFNATKDGYILFADVVKGEMTVEKFETQVNNYNIGAFIDLYTAVYERMND